MGRNAFWRVNGARGADRARDAAGAAGAASDVGAVVEAVVAASVRHEIIVSAELVG